MTCKFHAGNLPGMRTDDCPDSDEEDARPGGYHATSWRQGTRDNPDAATTSWFLAIRVHRANRDIPRAADGSLEHSQAQPAAGHRGAILQSGRAGPLFK
jgi:hypothetical protein